MRCEIDTLTDKNPVLKPVDDGEEFHFIAQSDLPEAQNGVYVIDEEDVKGPGAINHYEVEQLYRSVVKGSLSGDDVDTKWKIVLYHDTDTGTLTVDHEGVSAYDVAIGLNNRIATKLGGDNVLLPNEADQGSSEITVRLSDGRKVRGYLHELRDHDSDGFDVDTIVSLDAAKEIDGAMGGHRPTE